MFRHYSMFSSFLVYSTTYLTFIVTAGEAVLVNFGITVLCWLNNTFLGFDTFVVIVSFKLYHSDARKIKSGKANKTLPLYVLSLINVQLLLSEVNFNKKKYTLLLLISKIKQQQKTFKDFS